MKNLAVNYYRRGMGCSQCVLKAAETKYRIRLDHKVYDMAGTMNTGFGIGGMCSVVIAAVQVLGLLFDEDTAKARRIVFLSEFQKRYGGMNCSKLITKRTGYKKCEDLVYGTMELLEQVIAADA